MPVFLKILDFILKWILPFGLAGSSFILLTSILENKYRKSNLDVFWRRFLHWTIAIGIFALVISFVIHTKTYGVATNWLGIIAERLKNTAFIGAIVTAFQIAHIWLSQMWSYWSIIYGRAFAIIYVLGSVIELCALNWRISFWRAFNVIWPIVVMYPYLILKYAMGYQTPIEDRILAGVLKAKLRENLNDSYERIDLGLDANGKPFEEGAGGSVQAQTRSAVNQAMKRTRVTVKTTKDGVRRAHVLVRQTRETETDRAVEQILKGWGERVSGNSVYFPADAVYSSKEKGYIFDSSVPYHADERLGSYKSNFSNPFAEDVKRANGGPGAMSVMWSIIRNSIDYLLHLSPYAIYSRRKNIIDSKYYRDTSADKAKYKVQQNLDLSVLHEPKDKKGRSIEELKQLALKRAKSRVPDVTTALSSFGLYGQFKSVVVGGNTAIYNFTLPPDAKLPNNFDRVQEQIGNILRLKQTPIITLRAGILSVSLKNDVNIPVSFADMLSKRSKGTSEIISGLIGEDALGRPITFELGDSNPHVIIFGASGRGKTVLIQSLLYSIMSGTDPEHLRIIYGDGKGNSFETMKNNPFTYAPPANGNADMDYTRAEIIWLEKECRRRLELFRKAGAQKLSDYNKQLKEEGKKILPEILAVFDEFSAITDRDKELSPKDYNQKNVTDRFEYIAKMARAAGIRLLLANQTARKSKVPGVITANITARISLGVSEAIEAEIALPGTGIPLQFVTQPGEFYSLMHGPTNPEHGNSPYLTTEEMNALNASLEKKFGTCKYIKNRDQIFEESGLQEDEETTSIPEQASEESADDSQELPIRDVKFSEIKTPKDAPTWETGLGQMNRKAREDLDYALFIKAHEFDLIDNNPALHNSNDSIRERSQRQAERLRETVEDQLSDHQINYIDDREPIKSHPHIGTLDHSVHGTDKVL